MFKNVASQICMVLAWDTSADAAKTGDAANITAQISKDAGVTAASNDTNPTELDSTDAPGIYVFDLTQAETNCDHFLLYAVSSTSNIKLEPVSIYTRPATQDANVTQISGSSTAADNAEIVFATDFASNYDATNDVWKANVTLIEGVDATNQINSECDTALSDYDPPTKAEMDSGFAALNDPTAAEIRAEIDSNSTQLAAIVADTNELQTDDVPGLIAALNDLSSADVNAACDTALSDYDAVVPADLPSNFADLAITATTGRVTVGTNNDKTGYGLADDAITASKFDESTAFPLASADSGATQVARVGADGDTLETLSDQLDAITAAAIADAVWDESTSGHTTGGTFGEQCKTDIDAILDDTNELQTDDVPGLIAALNNLSSAEANAACDTALSDIHLDHLLAVDYDPASKPGTATALLNELIENDGGVSRFTANALEQAPSAGTNPNVLVDTTISSIDSGQTEIVLSDGSNDDDAYNDQAIVIYDASDNDYPSVRVVSDYVGSTKTATIDNPPDFTADAGDGVKIFVTAPGTSAPTAGQVADAVWNEPTTGHTTGGTFGEQCKTDIDAILEDTGTTLDGKLDTIDGIVDEIVADTNELQTDDVPGLIAALNDLSSADVNAACDTALSDYDPPTKAELDSGLAGLNDPSVVEIRTEIDSNSTQLAAIVADTNELQTDDIPGLIAALNDLSSADVNAACDTALADYDPPTKAELDSGLAALNDPTVAEIRVEIDSNSTQLAAIVEDTGTTLDGKLNTIDGIVDSILVDTGTTLDTKLDQMMHKDSGETFDQAYDSLEAIRDRGDSAWATGIDGIIKNTALDNFAFLMVDETDGYTPETGLTVTVQLSKNSGAFSDADQQSSIYEIGNGMYSIDFTANDMNADFIVVKCTATGARNRYIAFKTET